MKTFLTILSGILFWTIMIVPADDAPLSTYFIWFVYAVSILWVVRLVWKELEKWEQEDIEKKN